MEGKSLVSKGYAKVTYHWRHYCYTLTDEGIAYIRSDLGIEDVSVKPTTHRVRSDLEEAQKRGPRQPR